MAAPYNQRSVPEIIGDLFAQLTTLLRNEAQLARTEVSDNVASVGRGLGLMVGGAVLLIPALVILLEAGVAALIERGGCRVLLVRAHHRRRCGGTGVDPPPDRRE